MNGHSESGKFHPHSLRPAKNVNSKSIKKDFRGDDSLKGLPRSFRGYDVMNRKKVTVKEDIHKITMKNGRHALQGKSPLSPHITVNHIISNK